MARPASTARVRDLARAEIARASSEPAMDQAASRIVDEGGP
jgi:hypothetical protein